MTATVSTPAPPATAPPAGQDAAPAAVSTPELSTPPTALAAPAAAAPAAGDELLEQARSAFALVDADPARHRAAVDTLVDRLETTGSRAGSAEALVLALRAQAWADRSALDHAAAGRRLDRAVRLARRHALTEPLVEVLLSRASVNLERGRSAAAAADVRTAGALAERATPELWLTRAVLLQNLGRPAEATALYERVLRDRGGSARARAVAANNLALIHVQAGRSALASRYLDAAEMHARELPGLRAGVATSRAWATMQAGRLLEAVEGFEAAVPLYEAAGIPLGEHHLEYVDALTDLRLLDEARAVADRAVREFRSHGVALMAADGELRVASLALLAGDHRGAAVAADQAERTLREQRRTVLAARAAVVGVQARLLGTGPDAADLVRAARAARTLDGLGAAAAAVEAHLVSGRVAAGLHRRADARRHLDRAAELATPAPVLVRIRGRIAAGLRAELDGAGAEVLRQARSGLLDLDRHRAAFASLELRVLASAHGAELGRMGLAQAVRDRSGSRALDWMERTRAAALLAVEPVTEPGVDDDLVALRAVQTELAEAGAAGAADVAPLQARLREIEHRIARLTRSGRAARARSRAALSPADLRRTLDGRVLVEYAVLDRDLLAVVVEPRRTRVVSLGPVAEVQSRVGDLLFALRRLSRPGGSAEPARRAADRCLAALRALLVEPLTMAADVPVVAVPVGALRRIPWSALWSTPVTVAPSAAFWFGSLPSTPPLSGPAGALGTVTTVDGIHTAGTGGAPGTVALIAGPDLPGAREEVAAIRTVHADPVVLLPPDSTAQASADVLRRAGLAHLACHSRIRTDNPMFSSLQLSDGPLTLHEMGIRGVAPRRMVLAACNSAADTGYAANEVLGFVSALIARGTAGLAASIVVVPDLAAVPLMRRLHAGLAAGDTMGDALFSARAQMDPQDPADFVSWCAFNAYGGS